MRNLFKLAGAGLLATFLASPTFAAETTKRTILEVEAGSVSEADGLVEWQKFYEVASHPRCSNCHVGDSPNPMWSGPSYGKTRKHGMNIHAGESRIGAETLACGTCHGKENSAVKGGPPGAGSSWQLAPVEADWFGKSSSFICNQLKDPARNGDRTIRDVAAHLDHDEILHWAWAPGGDREPAPHSLQETMDFLMKWSAAGTPCPTE